MFCQNKKYLIIHADDFGMCRSVNAAIMDTIRRGVVTSTSIMVPCPWVGEVTELLKIHPAVDVGVHFTITSEWKRCRWRSLTRPSLESGLVDRSGYFFNNVTALRADVELEAELFAQIEHARKLGVNPSHLDSHMFALFWPEDLLHIYARAARSASLPFLLLPRLKPLINHCRLAPVDHLVFMDNGGSSATSWADWYDSILRSLKPGLTELIVHPGFDGIEMRALMGDVWAWGVTWRQRDYEVLTSARFRQSIHENNIELTTWAEVSRSVAARSVKH